MKLLTLLEQLLLELRVSHEVERMVKRAQIPTSVAERLIGQVNNKLLELNQRMSPLYDKRDRYQRPLIDTLPTTAFLQFRLQQPVKSEAGHLITGGSFIIGRYGPGFKIASVFTNVEPMTGQPMLTPDGAPLKKSGQLVDSLPMSEMVRRIEQLLQQ